MELCTVITNHNIMCDMIDKYELSYDEILVLNEATLTFVASVLEFVDNLPEPLAEVFGELITPKFCNYFEYVNEWLEIGDVRLVDTESFEMAGKDWHSGWNFNNKQPDAAVVQCFIYELRRFFRSFSTSCDLV